MLSNLNKIVLSILFIYGGIQLFFPLQWLGLNDNTQNRLFFLYKLNCLPVTSGNNIVLQ